MASFLRLHSLNVTAGALAPLPTLQELGLSLQLVFEPSGKFAYAPGADGNIRVYSVDPVSGRLTGITGGIAITSFFGASSSIGQSAVDPTGRYLYVVDGGTTNLLNAFSIDGTTGALSTIVSSPPIATGSGSFGIAVTPDGKYVYVTNSGDSTLSAYKVGTNGGLATIALGVTVPATLDTPEIPAIDPTSKFLYVPNNALSGTVSAFTINATDGTLTLIGSTATAAGADPFGTAVDPAGKFLFVTNSGEGTVSVFPIGGAGALGTAQNFNSGSGASSTPAGIAIDSSGAFAATVNNAENTTTFYGLANGVLTTKFTAETRTSAEFVSFYAGTTSPSIGPSNVFAANSGSGNVSGFIATPGTGVLAVGSGSPTAGQASTDALAADVTGTFLYSSSRSAKIFDGFAVAPSNAALTEFTTGSSFALTPNTDTPSEIQTEYTSRVVYVGDTTANNIQVFTTGTALTPTGIPAPFTSVKSIAVDPQGVFIIVLGNGSITSAGISGFTGTLQLGGAGTILVQAGNWTSGAIDPTGHWIVALDSTGKTLQSIAFTPVQNGFAAPDGTLTATGAPVATTGVTAPSSVVFDPLGTFVFVSDATNGMVTAFAFNAATGAITATGKTTTVSATGTGKVSIDAGGTFLYAAVTGNGGSTPSGVNAYKINADGSLTLVAGSPFATGAGTSGTSGVVVTTSFQ